MQVDEVVTPDRRGAVAGALGQLPNEFRAIADTKLAQQAGLYGDRLAPRAKKGRPILCDSVICDSGRGALWKVTRG